MLRSRALLLGSLSLPMGLSAVGLSAVGISAVGISAVGLSAVGLSAQDPPAVQDRPARTGHPLTLDRILNNPRSLVTPLPAAQWIPGSDSFSMVRPGGKPDRQVLAAFAATGGHRELFDLERFRTAMAAAGMPSADKIQRLPAAFGWVDRNTLRVQAPNGVYHWDLTSSKAVCKLSLPPGADSITCSSRDARAAYLLNHQLFVQEGTDRFAMVTKDGSEDIVYGAAAHRSEFGIHDGLWWGPNERYLACYREDLSPIAVYPYADHTVMPPKPIHGRYPMAGQVHSQVKVGVYDTKRRRLYYLEAEAGTGTGTGTGTGVGGKAKDVYWTNVTFGPKGEKIYVAIVNRDQDHMDLVRFDLATGKREKVLFREEDKEWIEPEQGPIFLPDKSGRFLWFSSRDGYRHLYLYGPEGGLVRQVTRGDFDVRRLVTLAGGKAFVMASGTTPLEMHLFEVDLDPSAVSGASKVSEVSEVSKVSEVSEVSKVSMRRRTVDPGWHSCQVSESGNFILDRFSNLETPGVLKDLSLEGKSLYRMEARHSIQNLPPQEFFTVTAEDGTTLHGHLFLPPDMVKGRRYPLLLYVYGGPHSQLVRNAFLGGGNLWLAYMATRGFLVARLDGRGTDNRGIEFSQKVFRRLGQLEVEDQVAAVKELSKRPYVDKNRVGVHGWSYGGYMTLSLMVRHPDLFLCGAAGAPVTDWAQYETGYTERYMDTPQQNPKGYADTSVLPLAKNLKGRLLILHGTNDKTVMWSHSLRFVDRCIDAGVLVDYMPYPMQEHGIRGKDRKHLYRVLTRFFEDNLKR